MATTTFNDLITFSRGSNATVTGPNGLIQWAPNNLLTNSQDFEAVIWSKQDLTATANALSAPDGTTTADRILEAATNTLHQVYVAYNLFTVGATYTWSIYAKAEGRSWFWLEAHDGGNRKTWFNLVDGTVGTNAPGNTATITPVGNGWYRISISRIAGGANGYFAFGPANADGASIYPGDITRGVNVWGAQLELGSTATTYNNTSVRNLLGFSEAFDNAAWSKNNASIVTGAQANPVNGLFNGQKFMEDTVNAQHILSLASAALPANTPVTMSVYAKAAGRQWLRLQPASGSQAWFDIQNGVLGTVQAGVTASITSVGNGWYRCSATTAYVNQTNYIFLANANNATSYTGDGNSGIYIYGAQLSNSASLDPYVPTPGAAPSSTAYYGPRFDYDPVTLLPRGLLVEEARTNLLPFSEQFDNAAWSKQNTTITANSAVAPDGTMTADTLTAATTGLFRYVQQQPTLTNGVTYTLTAYLKYKTARWVWLLGETTTDAFAVFDVLNGAVGDASSGITRSITPVGNGWYRCTATFLVGSATATQQVGIGLSDTNTVSNPPATAGIDAYIWGIQLETGAFATSYIPTIASTVTRSADVATITGSLFSQWYRQAEGTFVFDFGPFNFAGTMAGSAPYDTAVGAVTNGVRAGRQFSAQNQFGWNVQNKTGTPIGTSAISGSGGFAPLNGPAPLQKLAVFQTTTSMGGVVNGGIVSSTALTVTPTGASDLFYINPFMNGWFRSIRYVPVRAADFQLQALTELPLVPTLDVDFINNLYEA